jgi:hypothetical protein
LIDRDYLMFSLFCLGCFTIRWGGPAFWKRYRRQAFVESFEPPPQTSDAGGRRDRREREHEHAVPRGPGDRILAFGGDSAGQLAALGLAHRLPVSLMPIAAIAFSRANNAPSAN